MERLLFIREVDGGNIKIKEAEWGRVMNESDVPECFSNVDEQDPECVGCIVKVSCSLWRDKLEQEKREKFIEEQKKKEMEENEMGETTETKIETEAKVEEKVDRVDEDKAVEDGVDEVTKVDVGEVIKAVEEVQEDNVVEADTEEKEVEKKVDGVKAERDSNGKLPRGFVRNRVIEMLKEGTTRKEIREFTKSVGGNQQGSLQLLSELRKKGLLKEEPVDGVKKQDIRIHIEETG